MLLIGVDIESGGLDPNRHSLLEVAMVFRPRRGKTVEYQWAISRDEYVVTPEALAINKIDLVDLNLGGKEPDIVVHEIIQFLATYDEDVKDIILVGHNVAFDRQFLANLFKEVGLDINNYISYRTIDTSSLINTAKDMGLIAQDQSGSLHKLAKAFNIDTGEEHRALDDVKTTFAVYDKLKEILGGK